ncbi:glycosyltransferase family 2 protein [Parvularcula sp. ZS-1/3]|uniref:Glycosyltransferase family 2 protein n=1 Tax=Parvularcula mediterranea TaxID=2732508 RepID=A0A7Y3RK90_9PROT|nr:glycosyltransferase family 2 protein [Parvularcula mediterranea]NNU14922.1 glycosyltransferase family 2 protein [Parvularcula mediterranea]
MSSTTLSIIIPCFNEAENIGAVISEVLEKSEAIGAKIIVVDDGSDDGTSEAANSVSSDRLTVITHPNRAGKSAALRTGVLAADTIWIGTMDGDGQDNPDDLVRMSKEIDLGSVGEVGLVGGVRQNRTDGGSRKWASRAANNLRKSLLKDDCPDTACGLKMMPRDLFLAMPFFDALHRYFPAWTKHFGFEARYVPVTNRPRASGVSKYSNIGRAAAGFFDLMGVLWLMRRTHVPAPFLLLRPEGTR